MKHIPLHPFTDVTLLDLGSIVREIVYESGHGCSDIRSTFQYFARLKCKNGCLGCESEGPLGEVPLADCFTPAELLYLTAITGSLSYPGMREQAQNWTRIEVLVEATHG